MEGSEKWQWQYGSEEYHTVTEVFHAFLKYLKVQSLSANNSENAVSDVGLYLLLDPMKHYFHLLATTPRNLSWVGGWDLQRRTLFQQRLQSLSKQGSAFVNCVTACVTAAVTWLTPVWAREWMKGDTVLFLHEKLSDPGFSFCSCMYLVCLSPLPLLCAQYYWNQHFSSTHLKHPVHSDMRKFNFEWQQSQTNFEFKNGLVFICIYPKRTLR